MPKMKTRRALKKRVRKNAEGKLKRGYAFRSHLALDKSTKQKRHLRKRPFMHPSDEKRLKSLLQD